MTFTKSKVNVFEYAVWVAGILRPDLVRITQRELNCYAHNAEVQAIAHGICVQPKQVTNFELTHTHYWSNCD